MLKKAGGLTVITDHTRSLMEPKLANDGLNKDVLFVGVSTKLHQHFVYDFMSSLSFKVNPKVIHNHSISVPFQALDDSSRECH